MSYPCSLVAPFLPVGFCFQFLATVRDNANEAGCQGLKATGYGYGSAADYTEKMCTDSAAASPFTMPPPFSVSPTRGLATCRSPASPRSCVNTS